METLNILDVTVLEPRLKHPTIFQKFDELEKGDAFIIHNDHDPKPLYYQLLAERGNVFTWEYQEEGPEWWKVQIGKFKEGEKESTIGDLVSKDFRKAEVFKKFGLDFCCGGKKTLTKACKEKGLDVVQIEKELKAIDEISSTPSQDYNTWDLDFLADYILNTHHKYVTQAIPVIQEYTQKVAKVHGERHPEAIEIANSFVKVADELMRHMVKEENVLFPYIKKLAAAQKSGTMVEPPHFGSIENPINMMEAEHEEVGNVMEKINMMSYGYTPPADACTTYRLSYAKLKEFEDDLHQHIHLENNILFPKAIALENDLFE
jgi:regulator of cell morphogenesis and NO signaling